MTNNKMEEEWRPIKGFEAYFMVSNYGRIRRFPRTFSNKRYGFESTLKYREYGLTLKNKNKYINLKLTVEGVTHSLQLHRVVARAFCVGYVEGYVVNHIDGNKHNNCSNNLEWTSQKNNVKHAKENGLARYALGSDSGNSKIDEEVAISIKNLLSAKIQNRYIVFLTGTTAKIVSDIKTGRTWSHIKEAI